MNSSHSFFSSSPDPHPSSDLASTHTLQSSTTGLDSEEASSATDPLLGPCAATQSCELDEMGKTKDDTSIDSTDHTYHVDVAPIHHGAAVWETRDTYGPAGEWLFLLLLLACD